MAFVGFLILIEDAFFIFSHFSLIAIAFRRTQHLVLVLVEMHSAAASIWVVPKFSYASFRVCFTDVSWRVSNLFLQLPYNDFLYHLVSEDQSYCKALTVCFLFLYRLRWIFAMMVLWSKDTPSKEEYASQFTVLYNPVVPKGCLGWCMSIFFHPLFGI